MADFTVGKKLGRVAEFCPICRAITSADFHATLVTVGKVTAQGFAVRCQTCGFLRASCNEDYRSAESDPSVNLNELIARTHPYVREKNQVRLAVEELVKDGRLDAVGRDELLREPFRLLGPGIDDPPQGSGPAYLFAGGVVLFFALLIAAALLPKGPDWWAMIGAVSTFGLTLSLIPILAVLSPFMTLRARRRHLTGTALPQLARALSPLNPAPQELENVVGGLRSLGIPGMRHLEAKVVYSAVIEFRKA